MAVDFASKYSRTLLFVICIMLLASLTSCASRSRIFSGGSDSGPWEESVCAERFRLQCRASEKRLLDRFESSEEVTATVLVDIVRDPNESIEIQSAAVRLLVHRFACTDVSIGEFAKRMSLSRFGDSLAVVDYNHLGGWVSILSYPKAESLDVLIYRVHLSDVEDEESWDGLWFGIGIRISEVAYEDRFLFGQDVRSILLGEKSEPDGFTVEIVELYLPYHQFILDDSQWLVAEDEDMKNWVPASPDELPLSGQ